MIFFLLYFAFLLTTAFIVKLQKARSPRQSLPITKQNGNNRFQHSFLQPMKCRVQNNEISTCSLSVKTDSILVLIWLFSANLTNFNPAIWMVNRSDVNEKETPINQSIINQYFIEPRSVEELVELIQNTYVPLKIKKKKKKPNS